MKRWPICSATKSWKDWTTLSLRMHLSTSIFWNCDSLSSHGAGRVARCASLSSKYARHASTFSTKDASNSWKAGSMHMDLMDDQICAVIQSGDGLGVSEGWPSADPERRKRHSTKSMRFSPMSTLMHTVKEKRSLCVSKSDRHTFTYNEYVKKSFRLTMRVGMSSAGSESSMARLYRLTNHGREYWYMGSTRAMSATQKKRRAARKAHGLYSSRVVSISSDVFLASATLTLMSSEVTLDCASVLMSCSSSRISPLDSERRRNIWSSISLSCFCIAALVTTRLFLVSSRSGRSLATTMPRSWSSRPSCVMVKLSSVTLTDASGG
mmetsp:Transcript_18089/g.56665  ORF Transcript_18089/g.56665 Transcript_18089/m.56665 type:complete len:323 (+) Transcript_18089:80-1048(+)